MADHIDQSTAPLDEKLRRFLRGLADEKCFTHFHFDGFPRPSLANEAAAFLADIEAGRLNVACGVPAAPDCGKCRENGVQVKPCECLKAQRSRGVAPSQASSDAERPRTDANELERMAKARPDECFLKGSGVLKLIGAIRQLESELRALRTPGVAPSHSSASEHGETPEQEAFCDRNCCWSGHHPDCVRHTPPAAPGVAIPLNDQQENGNG